MTAAALAFAMLLLVWAGVLLAFAAPLAARWREPVLRPAGWKFHTKAKAARRA
ncbi:MAG TPA: hypothetical protein PLQ95_12155 [Thiobacillus sp.]|nr:hypothetical protein [Thiobacillus sp.]